VIFPQQRGHVCCKPLRIFVQLAPRQPDHSPPGGVQGSVAGAVALERRGGVMGGSAVELHDQSTRAPHTVALHSLPPHLDPDIDLRTRQAVGIEEGKEANLEAASGDCRSSGAGSEDLPQRRGAGTPLVPGENLVQGQLIGQLDGFGSLYRALELVGSDHGAEIEQGAGWTGYRDSFHVRGLVGG